MEEAKTTVLVTGISGYIASETCYQLLERGYRVRGTVRSVKNEEKLKPIRALHPAGETNLEFVEGDLNKSEGWAEAMVGVDYILHMASPFVMKVKKDSDLIDPAVNGALNVMKAASKAPNIKGVVLTSSCIAVYPHKFDQLEHHYTEKDWADAKETGAYGKSKLYAEQKAWEFWNTLDESSRFKFATINPSQVVGAQRVANRFTSAEVVLQFFDGSFPAIPRISFPFVAVCDVARAHILAMENFDKSNGNRYICSEKTYPLKEVMGHLAELKSFGYKVPSSEMKYCMFSLAGLFKAEVKEIKPLWGRTIVCHHDKICEELGFEFTPVLPQILNMAYECIKRGLIKDKTKGAALERDNFAS